MAQQISREEWERRYGRGRGERPQPQNIPGLPPADEVLSELAYVRQLEDAAAPADPGRAVAYSQRFGPQQDNVFSRLFRGRRGEGRAMDEAQLQQRLADELTRQSLVAGESQRPDALFAAALGRPVSSETAALAQAYLTLPGNEPLTPAEAVALAEQSGATAAARGPARRSSDPQLAQLAQIVAQKGEIGPDQGLQQTLIAANRGLIDPALPIEPQLAALSPEDAAELALRARSLTQLEQLSADDTALTAQSLGAGRTIGGRRNPFRKEKSGAAEAAVLRTPGNVLSAGLEFPQGDVLLPILVAPKSQQVWSEAADPMTPEMQVAQYYAGKDEAGRSRFAPSLRDARVLYVNPYAELPLPVVERLGLDPVLVPVEKDVSGAYDQDALNVPIPDVGEAANVLPPKADPGYRAAVNPVYRNPTFAEAVNALSLKYRTPIKDFTEDMLLNRGRYYADALVDRPDVAVFALGNKRLSDGAPAPIAAYFEQPADPMAPPVASVRVGGGQKRSLEFYSAFDDLVDALAGGVYGRGPVAAELAGASRYKPAPASTLPGVVRYGALMNLRSTDPLVADYQRRLLDEAGFPVTSAASNPLLGVVDLLEQLSAAPPSDAPLPQVARSAADAEPAVAPRGQSGAARLLARAKQPLLNAAAASRPTTDRSRQGVERATAELLQRLLGGEATAQPRPEPSAPVAASRPRERFRQPLIPGTEAALLSSGYRPDPADALARYMAVRAPEAPVQTPERVVQYVPEELYSRFWQAPAAAAPQAPLQQRTAAALRRQPERQLDLGLQLPYSATGYTPDPVDALSSYMARQARAQAAELPRRTPDGDSVLAAQPRTPDVVQTALGLERLAQQQRQQVVSEQASAVPQAAVTQTSEQSPLNAPPAPATSPSRQADELLRRYRARLLS